MLHIDIKAQSNTLAKQIQSYICEDKYRVILLLKTQCEVLLID